MSICLIRHGLQVVQLFLRLLLPGLSVLDLSIQCALHVFALYFHIIHSYGEVCNSSIKVTITSSQKRVLRTEQQGSLLEVDERCELSDSTLQCLLEMCSQWPSGCAHCPLATCYHVEPPAVEVHPDELPSS